MVGTHRVGLAVGVEEEVEMELRSIKEKVRRWRWI